MSSASRPALPSADPHGHLGPAFLVLDTAGRCTHASADAAARLGVDAGALVGRPLTRTLPTAAALHAAVARAADAQQPATFDEPVAGRALPSPEGVLVLLDPEAAPAEPWAEGADAIERARYLHAVLDTVPECIKVVTPDGRLLDINRAGLAMIEAESRDTVFGWKVERVVAPPHLATYRRVLAAALAGTPDRAELDIVTLRGRLRRVDTRFAPLRDAEGAIVGALSVTVDVTDRHADAQRLRASEARFRQLAASAPIGIFLGNARGQVVWVNARFEAIWQLSAERAVGNGFQVRVHPDDLRPLLDAASAALAAGDEFTREHRIVLDDGSVRWLRAHVVRLSGTSGRGAVTMGTTEDVTDRRAATEAEERARTMADVERARLDAVLEALPAGIIFADADGRIVRATRQARALWGGDVVAASADQYGRYRARLRGGDRPLADEERGLTRALRGETTAPRELEIERLDGGTTTVLSAAAPVRDPDGHIVGGVVALIDVSERVQLEAQLRQAQKMEAVGQLAGGVAHDFNNLLTVINGNLEFARDDIGPDHPVQEDLAEVARAAERARSLVRQLLAFSRKQVVQPKDVDVNEIVRGADTLLRRVLGDEIVFATSLAPRPAVVRADRGQIEQVLLNLAVNARDAMLTAAHGLPGTGGTLTISTDVVRLTTVDAGAWSPLTPGRYARLRVSDTGHGMDEMTLAHIFEPFFTTKAVGVGTGLGLATVYGIVAQAGGAVRVDSAPGAGTTFTILLPHHGAAATATEHGGGTALPRGRGTVLVVEDEASVRIATRRLLERQGYAVLEARHGADALLVWREHGSSIVACVTDLRMPEMGGRELVAQLRADRPDLPVVYLSGYADRDVADARAGFVEKPFTGDALLAALHSAIGQEGN